MHLYSNYTRIYVTEMAEIDECLQSRYNAEEPIESLVKRLKECADFAMEESKPVTKTQLVRIVYRMVNETKQYQEYCWTRRAINEKSWTSFQANFIEYQADL